MFVFLWIVLSIAVGIWASSKKIWGGFFWSCLASLCLSPIIGFIIVATAKPSESRILEDGMKKCPNCAEFIKEEAKVCRFCGKEF